MTVALINQEPAPMKVRSVASQPQLRKWLGDLEHLHQEAGFYHRLLSLGLPNCTERTKPEMKKLVLDFGIYKNEILPSLKHSLQQLMNKSVTEPEMILDVSKKLEQHNEHLKKMKSKVFPFLHELQVITFL